MVSPWPAARSSGASQDWAALLVLPVLAEPPLLALEPPLRLVEAPAAVVVVSLEEVVVVCEPPRRLKGDSPALSAGPPRLVEGMLCRASAAGASVPTSMLEAVAPNKARLKVKCLMVSLAPSTNSCARTP